MAEILSQDEINALLTAISTGDVEPAGITRAKEQRKVRIYDFRRPDMFTKDQIRTLQMIHEVYAHRCTQTLFQKLHTSVAVHIASVDQLTYEEFVRSIPNPTTMITVDMRYMGGKAVLEIDPSITSAIIHTLFGGENEGNKQSRELTGIEQSIMEEIVNATLLHLRAAWFPIIDISPIIDLIETNPQSVQIASPNEMVILITLEAKIGDTEGMINLCIPYTTLESVIPDMSMQNVIAKAGKNKTYTENKIPVPDFSLDASASVFGGSMLFKDLLLLEKGSRLPIENIVNGKASIDLSLSGSIVHQQRMILNEWLQLDIPKSVGKKIIFGENGGSGRKGRKAGKRHPFSAFTLSNQCHLIRTGKEQARRWIALHVRQDILSRFLKKLPNEALHNLMLAEYPYVAAALLQHLEEKRSVVLLSSLPDEKREYFLELIKQKIILSREIEYAVCRGIHYVG